MAEDIRENAMAGGTPARLRGLDVNGNSISPTIKEVEKELGITITTGSITVSGLTIRATANDYFVEIAIQGTATEDIERDVVIPGVNIATQAGAMWKSLFPGISTRNYNAIYISAKAGVKFGDNNWDVKMYSRF